MIRNLATLISLTVVFSGSFALSIRPAAAAKTSQNSSRKARNYFVPPPPPYTPAVVYSALGMTNAQALTADAHEPVVEKPVNPYSKYIFTRRNQTDMPQVLQTKPYASYDPAVEARALKLIDYYDSEMSSHKKELDKLLNLKGKESKGSSSL